MITWKVYVMQGIDILLWFHKDVPKGMRPPAYVNDVNNTSSIPLVGEFEKYHEDEDHHMVWYEKINPFLGGN